MRGGNVDNSLWAQALVHFETKAPGIAVPRRAALRRPHGIIGRIIGADIAVTDIKAETRHAYLHVDARGVHVVDLATRSGTRVNGRPIVSAWLRPGDVIEIEGWEITLKDIQLNGYPIVPDACDDDMLADSGDRPLAELALVPRSRGASSWAVGSELIFLGLDEASRVRLGGGSPGELICALLRGPACAYVIDLQSRRTRHNERIVRGAARLAHGDHLTIHNEQFTVHIETLSGEHPLVFQPEFAPSRPPLPPVRPGTPLATHQPTAADSDDSSESGESALSWMLDAMQVSHGELLRRQRELEAAIGELLKQVQSSSSTNLDSQREHIETLNEELSELRRKLEDSPGAPTEFPARIDPPTAPTPPSAPSAPLLPVPVSPPIPPARPTRPDPVGPPAPVSERSRETATWLLQRIDRVGNERRFSLRSLFAFLLPRPRELLLDEDGRLIDGENDDFDEDNEASRSLS